MAEWYVRIGGEVSGPFDIETMRGFRRSGLLKAESDVSLLSMPGQWITAGETEVFRDPPSHPTPPTAADTESASPPDDRFAWGLAVAVLAVTMFEAQAFRIGIPPFYENWVINWDWIFCLLLSGILASTDIRKNSDRLSGRYVVLIFIVPLYFWWRKRKMTSSPVMLFVNVASVALAVTIQLGKLPIAGGLNLQSCYSTSLQDEVTKLMQTPSFNLRGRVELLRSVHEENYDGRTRVCRAEVITDGNVRYTIEFSTETSTKDGEEYIRVRTLG